MTNATVSHELRNPLNSITAQNIMKLKLYEDLKSRMQQDPGSQKIIEELEEVVKIQDASIKVMGCMI